MQLGSYLPIAYSSRFSMQNTYSYIMSAAYMTRLTFVYVLYSLYIVCMYKKHSKAVSFSYSQFSRFCIVCSQLHYFCICYVQKNIQHQLHSYLGRFSQLVVTIGFVQFVHCLYVQKTYISSFATSLTNLKRGNLKTLFNSIPDSGIVEGKK